MQAGRSVYTVGPNLLYEKLRGEREGPEQRVEMKDGVGERMEGKTEAQGRGNEERKDGGKDAENVLRWAAPSWRQRMWPGSLQCGLGGVGLTLTNLCLIINTYKMHGPDFRSESLRSLVQFSLRLREPWLLPFV